MQYSSRNTMALVIALACVTSVMVHGQQVAPRNGTWELDLQKSTFNPGPGPRQQTRVDKQTDQGLEAVLTGTTGTGAQIEYRYSPKFDGKDVPIVGTGVPSGADAITVRVIDARTLESTLKRAGKVVLTRTEVVSPDGRTLTITSKGLDVSGVAASNVTVYSRR